jgi:hypothetical protein
MSFKVQLEAANVPESLAGAPLSVEIISHTGNAEQVLLPLTSDPVVADVKGPGPYLIRTTLPSGRLISDTITSPKDPNAGGDTVSTAVLDLQEHDAVTDFWREAKSLLQIAAVVQASRTDSKEKDAPLPPWLVAATQDLVRRAVAGVAGAVGGAIARWLDRGTLAYEGHSPHSEKDTPKHPPARETAPASNVSHYQWGIFAGWTVAPPQDGRRGDIPTLRVRSRGTGTVDPRGEIPPPDRGDSIEPCLIKLVDPASDDATLIVWLPGVKQRPAKIAMDPHGATYRSGSAFLAFPDPEDPITTTLFAYVRKGALEPARLGVPVMTALLKTDKALTNPNQALLAGYVLYKLQNPYMEELLAGLLPQYSKLADAHILAGSQLIANGKIEEAIEPFAKALECGVPIYSEGTRLLRDGSNFLRDFHPGQTRFLENARKAASIATAANFGSALNCLRIGADLAVEFVDE